MYTTNVSLYAICTITDLALRDFDASWPRLVSMFLSRQASPQLPAAPDSWRWQLPACIHLFSPTLLSIARSTPSINSLHRFYPILLASCSSETKQVLPRPKDPTIRDHTMLSSP